MLISNKYEVESLLGRGIMGEVYKARDVASGVLSVVKVLPSRLTDHPDLLAHLHSEVRVLAKMVHPNIARIVEIDHDDEFNFDYLVMEYLQGRTLRDCLDDGKTLSFQGILSFSRQIANALQMAHRRKPPVIHRNIKPSNIMIEEGSHRAVLMDFGLIKESDEEEMGGNASTSALLRYRPPEQLRAEPLDASADWYALGMVMYEAYAGTHWLAGLSDNQIAASILSDRENEPEFAEGTPAEFKALIGRMIAKDRAKRYHSAGEVLADLEKCESLHVEGKEVADIDGAATGNLGDTEPLQKAAEGKTAADEAGPFTPNAFPNGGREAPVLEDHRLQKEDVSLPEANRTTELLLSDKESGDSVIALEQAEQAKLQADAAKIEADGYHSKDKATAFYERALTFQIQGETFFNAASYRQAIENFGEALRHFQDAREFAYYAVLKEDTEKLSDRVKAAHGDAVKADAKVMAPVLFNKAFEAEQKARAALAFEDVPEACRLFRSALEVYQLTLQQVGDQQKQLEMLKARKQSLELWHRARQAGAEQLIPKEFAEALSLKDQGQHWEDRQKLELAADYYNRAARAFEQVQKKTDSLAVQEQADIVRRQVLDAQADHRPLRNWAKNAWPEGDSLSGKADSAWTQQQFLQAKKLYAKALAAYSRAEQQALAEQSFEQAQSLQVRLQEIHRLAQHCQVENHCQTLYRLAVDAETAGQNSQNKRKFQEAVKHLTQSCEYYEQAVSARLDQLKREITSVRQQSRGQQVQDYAGALYHKGLSALMAAEELREQSRLDQAYDRYCESYRFFIEAFETAKQRIHEEKAEAVPVPDQVPPVDDRISRQTAENGKNGADKTNSMSRVGRTSGRYRQTDEATAGAETEADRSLEGLNRVIPGKNGSADAELRGRPKAAGIQRRFVALLLIAALAASGLMVVDNADVKRLLGGSEPHNDLTITKVMPSEETLKLAAGQSQSFAVEVSGPRQSDLAYTWYLDGKEQSSSEQWLYTPVFNAAETAAREIKVVISSQEDHLLAKIWKVDVLPPPQPAVGSEASVRHAPKIVIAEPGEQNVSVKPNETVFFSVEARDDDVDDQLAYAWTLDGQEVSQRMAWNYKAKQQGHHEVVLTVTDKTGMQDEHVWNIIANKPIDNHPPRIVKAAPAERMIELAVGAGVQFSAEATDAESKGTLNYTWYADRQKQSSSNAWFYTVPSEGRHRISLKVADSDGLETYRTWYVTARETAPACISVDESTDLCMPETDKPEVRASEATVSASNHPPAIVSSSPSGSRVEALLGKATIFSVEAIDPDRDELLSYSWFLDGREQSTNVSWPFIPQAAGRHQIALIVSDRAGKQVKQSWTVDAVSPPASCIAVNEKDELCLPEASSDGHQVGGEQKPEIQAGMGPGGNHAPRIASSQPSESRLELLLGKAANFSAEVFDPDPEEQLSYSWLLDGQLQSANASWSYMPEAVGRHKVTLTVSDRAGKQVQKTWLIDAVSPPAQCISLEEGNELCMPVQ